MGPLKNQPYKPKQCWWKKKKSYTLLCWREKVVQQQSLDSTVIAIKGYLGLQWLKAPGCVCSRHSLSKSSEKLRFRLHMDFFKRRGDVVWYFHINVGNLFCLSSKVLSVFRKMRTVMLIKKNKKQKTSLTDVKSTGFCSHLVWIVCFLHLAHFPLLLFNLVRYNKRTFYRIQNK